MENVKKVKAGELAIKNDEIYATKKCCNLICPNADAILAVMRFYTLIADGWIGYDIADQDTPTILATELLKEIEAGEQNPESRISELTAKKEAIEAEIEKLKANKEYSKKFNAERALAGEPCETTRGEKVLAIHRNPVRKDYPLYACMKNGIVRDFTIDGFYFSDERQSALNLKMS